MAMTIMMNIVMIPPDLDATAVCPLRLYVGKSFLNKSSALRVLRNVNFVHKLFSDIFVARY